MVPPQKKLGRVNLNTQGHTKRLLIHRDLSTHVHHGMHRIFVLSYAYRTRCTHCACMIWWPRQRGRAVRQVRALDLQCGGPEFKSRPNSAAGFIHGSLEFKSSTTLIVNSQLVCPRPVGILTLLCLIWDDFALWKEWKHKCSLRYWENGWSLPPERTSGQRARRRGRLGREGLVRNKKKFFAKTCFDLSCGRWKQKQKKVFHYFSCSCIDVHNDLVTM